MNAKHALLAAGLALALSAGAAFAHGPQDGGSGYGMMGPGMMGQGYGMAPGYGMGPGMMGPGYGPGPGYGMHPGYGPGPCYGYGCGYGYGPGYGPGPGYGMGPGMMGPGYGMGPGMMGPGMMGPGYGMMGPGYGTGPGPQMYGYGQGGPDRDLSADDIKTWLERRLAWGGNPHLKLGEVKDLNDDTIVAEIVTKDGSLVDKLEIDRHTGAMRRVE